MLLLTLPLLLLWPAASLAMQQQQQQHLQLQQQQQQQHLQVQQPQDQPKGRILFYLPTASQSLLVGITPVAEDLLGRGHRVVLLTGNLTWTPEALKGLCRFEHIRCNVSNVQEKMDSLSSDVFGSGLMQHPAVLLKMLRVLYEFPAAVNGRALAHPRLREELEVGFDVVVVVPWPPGSEAGYYLAERSCAALVLWHTEQISYPFLDWAFGQPHGSANLPFIIFDLTGTLPFVERVANWLIFLALHWIRLFVVMMSESMLDHHFPGEARSPLLEIERNASLGLHFGHPFLHGGMRPTVPNFEHLSMLNCKEPKDLPSHLENFMAGSSQGVIYVSFGTVIKSSLIDVKKLHAFLSAFGLLKQNILWKWEEDQMEGRPDNVKVAKWLPQQDILGHAKTKLFITHGGQASFQEALCHGVPVIVIPLLWDQFANAKEVERIGFGKILQYQQLTKDSLLETIREVIGTPKYAQTALEYKDLLNDQMTRPLERVVWWFEFLLRHPSGSRGRRLLRSPSHDLRWYQHYDLDILLFMALVLLSCCGVLTVFCRSCFKKRRQPRGSAMGEKKKKQ